MSPAQRPFDPQVDRGARLDDDGVLIDLTGPEPVVTDRSLLIDLRERVDGRVRDGRWGLLAILAVLQVLDVATTHQVLASGGIEGNPLMAPVVEGGWLAPLGMKLAVCTAIAAIVACCPSSSSLVRRGLTAVTGIYVAIVAWNLAILAALH